MGICNKKIVNSHKIYYFNDQTVFFPQFLQKPEETSQTVAKKTSY